MKDKVSIGLLLYSMKKNSTLDITVQGISMLPTLIDGDVITIKACEEYIEGDILVFRYKEDSLLVHRLIKKENGVLYCKGDNSFRLEDISPSNVFGKVVASNGKKIKEWPKWKIQLSYCVNREFVKLRYDIDSAKKTNIYKMYSEFVLGKVEKNMYYKKNPKMEYISIDESVMAIVDIEKGDTCLLDETGIDIINVISEGCDYSNILKKLCFIYSTNEDEIIEDLQEFLSSATEKGILIVSDEL